MLIFDILLWENVSQEFRCVQRAIVVLGISDQFEWAYRHEVTRPIMCGFMSSNKLLDSQSLSKIRSYHIYIDAYLYIYIALHYILQIELVIGHAIAVTIVPVDHGPNALVIHGSSMFS